MTAVLIKIFYHICLINNWQAVVSEQLHLMEKSGLYGSCDAIYIGAAGSRPERKKLMEMIEGKSKIHLVTFDSNIQVYEFLTLKVLREKAFESDPFYGFYFHTKGVSHPNNASCKLWRDYANYYNITYWKENVKNLDAGYDLSGCALVTESEAPAYKRYYNTNYFWFRSEYIKTLPPIEKLRLHNRFEAELWVGANTRNTATLCQWMCDYKTVGQYPKYAS